MFHNTGANAFAKNQMHLAYEDKRDLYCTYSDFSDSEDSEWEDAGNRSIRKMVEHYNFDLVAGMTPMVYVPIPQESRRKRPKEDLIYRLQLPEPDNEYGVSHGTYLTSVRNGCATAGECRC